MGKSPSDRDFEAGRRGGSAAHRGIFLGLLAVFSALTFAATSSGSASDVASRPRILTTLLTVSGPFTGAIARNGQECCLAVSMELAAWLAPALGVALASWWFLAGRRGMAGAAGLILWTLGWLAWLAGGIVSFGHALS